MRWFPRRTRAFAAAALAAAGGCAGSLNEEVGLRGAEIPALAAPTGATELEGSPSLAGSFDRGAWGTVAVTVPQRQVGYHPAFAGFFPLRGDRGPWDPAFPAAGRATVDETDAGEDLAEGATELLVTAGTIVAVPVAAAVVDPWAVDRGPFLPYERLPAP